MVLFSEFFSHRGCVCAGRMDVLLLYICNCFAISIPTAFPCYVCSFYFTCRAIYMTSLDCDSVYKCTTVVVVCNSKIAKTGREEK